MTETVALIGVGALGKALLQQILKTGRRVQAYDVNEAARSAAAQLGASVAPSAAAAAKGASRLHVLVASDQQLIDATLGTAGVLDNAERGSVLLLHSTVLPATTVWIAHAAAEKGVTTIDAPITGVPQRLAAGHGVFLVGGPDDAVAGVRSYLLELGSDVYQFGPLGSGNVAKLAKNLYNASERVLLSEILDLVAAGGIDMRQFMAMQIASSPRPAATEWEENFTLADGRAKHRPTTNLFGKDVAIAAAYSRSLGLEAPLTEGVARTAEAWLLAWGQKPRG